jgi:hypothetical protein
LRNKNLFEQYNTKIFVPSKERYDSRGYFRFALIQEKGKKTYYPTQDVTAICIKKGAVKEDIEYVLGMLNSRPLQKWIVYNGFSRGGVYDFSEKPISIIPIPRVNWQNQKEVEFHRLIAEVVKEIITKKCFNLVDELNNYIMKFLEIKEKIRPLSLDSFINQHPSFE